MAFTQVTRATTLIKDGWGAFNTLIDDLLSVANGKGASQVGIEDTAGNMSATNVEDAIAEIYTDHSTTKVLAETFDENPATTTTGLVWGYKGGLFRLDSTVTTVSAGTIALTDDATNYVEIDPSDGLVKKNTTSFASGRIPVRTIVTASGEQTTSTDKRAWFTTTAFATNAETITGTITGKAVTPSGLSAKLNTFIEATTSMIFNQAAAPTGWTKKSDWAANASLIIGNAYGNGGSDSPTSWATVIGVSNHATHVHTGPSHAHTVTVNNHTLTINEIPSHTHALAVGVAGSGLPYSVDYPNYTGSAADAATTLPNGGGAGHNHTGSTAAEGTGNTGSGGPTTHSITQDTYVPIYQIMIAASKD